MLLHDPYYDYGGDREHDSKERCEQRASPRRGAITEFL